METGTWYQVGGGGGRKNQRNKKKAQDLAEKYLGEGVGKTREFVGAMKARSRTKKKKKGARSIVIVVVVDIQ